LATITSEDFLTEDYLPGAAAGRLLAAGFTSVKTMQD
jgi:hypothetical protein